MSAFCPEGQGTCKDAATDACVVGYPCELYPLRRMTHAGLLSTEDSQSQSIAAGEPWWRPRHRADIPTVWGEPYE